MTMLAAIERAEFRMRCLELAQKCWNDPHVTHQKLSLYDLADRFLRYVTEADAPKPDVQAFDVEGGDPNVYPGPSPDREGPNPFTISQPGTTGGSATPPGESICASVSPEPSASEFTRPAAGSFERPG